MACLKEKINRKLIISFIGLILCISGLLLVFNHYHKIKIYNSYSDNKIAEFFDNDILEVENDNLVIQGIKENNNFDKRDEDYIAILEIPAISLKRGLLSPNSYYNKVNYNIQIINNSIMPDIINGNLVLAGHNGARYVSFFKDLYKLNINDKVYIYYHGYKYEYSINNIYDTSKDGDVEIYRDSNKTTLTLITCKRNTKDIQTVYIGYQTNKELY